MYRKINQIYDGRQLFKKLLVKFHLTSYKRVFKKYSRIIFSKLLKDNKTKIVCNNKRWQHFRFRYVRYFLRVWLYLQTEAVVKKRFVEVTFRF